MALKKGLVRGILAIVLFFCVVYGYAIYSSQNVFACDANSYLVKAPETATNTTHQYYFRLVNHSHMTVKVLNIELDNYQGVKVSHISVSGSAIYGKLITKDQRVTVDYDQPFWNPVFKHHRVPRLRTLFLGLNTFKQ